MRQNEKKVGNPLLVISHKTAMLLAWHRYENWEIQCEYCWDCVFHPAELKLDKHKMSLAVDDYKPAPRLETLQTWLKEKHKVASEPDEKSLYEALLAVTPKEHIDHEILMRTEKDVLIFEE